MQSVNPEATQESSQATLCVLPHGIWYQHGQERGLDAARVLRQVPQPWVLVDSFLR